MLEERRLQPLPSLFTLCSTHLFKYHHGDLGQFFPLCSASGANPLPCDLHVQKHCPGCQSLIPSTQCIMILAGLPLSLLHLCYLCFRLLLLTIVLLRCAVKILRAGRTVALSCHSVYCSEKTHQAFPFSFFLFSASAAFSLAFW